MNIPTDDELYADYVECMGEDALSYEQWSEGNFDCAMISSDRSNDTQDSRNKILRGLK